MGLEPEAAAMCSGIEPAPVRKLTDAPASRSSPTTSILRRSQATERAVWLPSAESGSAFVARREQQRSTMPRPTASSSSAELYRSAASLHTASFRAE
eukprot:scaffold544_cov117-Isochrysis_galbana.AAC.16